MLTFPSQFHKLFVELGFLTDPARNNWACKVSSHQFIMQLVGHRHITSQLGSFNDSAFDFESKSSHLAFPFFCRKKKKNCLCFIYPALLLSIKTSQPLNTLFLASQFASKCIIFQNILLKPDQEHVLGHGSIIFFC